MPRYQPPDAMESPRIGGIRTFMRLPHVRTTEDIDFAVVGIPFDTSTTYRVGARFGPQAIRAGSTMLRPFNPYHGVDLFEHLSGVDYGDVGVVPGYIEASYERIEAGLRPIIDAGVIPIGLGGDHSITLAELRALSKRHGPLGLVQIDAHPDTWEGHWGKKYNHGTVFRRATEEGVIDPHRVIQVGLRGSIYGYEDYDQSREMGMEVITMQEFREIGLQEVTRRIRARCAEGPTFLTYDIDSWDPAYAPGTGTPEVEGFTSHEGLSLVRGMTDIDFVGADLVEVYPMYDHAEITAIGAANVLFELISLLALRKRDRAARG
jgi:agmatinase